MFRGLLFFIRQGWRYDKRYILWLILDQLFSALLPVVATLMPKLILDELLGEARPAHLGASVAALAGYTLISTALCHYFRMDGFTRRCCVAAEFDHDLHRRLAEADFAHLEDPAFLDMQEKAKKFLYCDWHGFGYLLDCAVGIAGRCVTLAGMTAIMATLNGWIVLLFTVLALVSALAEGRARRRAMALSLGVSADQRGVQYYSTLFEDFGYGKELRLGGMSEWMLARERGYVTRVNDNLAAQNGHFIRAGAVGAACTFVQQCAAYAYLVAQVIGRGMSVADFTMYLGAVTAFAAALRGVMQAVGEIRAYDLYYAHLDRYLAVPATLRGGTQVPPAGAHTIEFRDVGFRYPGSAVWALRHLNLTLRPGEKLAVVGENGAGKTTLVKLLTRLYAPTEGAILIDGIDAREIDCACYASLFATVLQDYCLFAFSLGENVALAQPYDAARIERVLRQVGLGGKLDSLPRGIDTPVYRRFDEDGFEPSGGEGQKIALARALYRDASIVILDEPTAALDPRAEAELYRRFDELVGGKTAVYISHRLSSARFCDKIAVLDRGELVEYGGHEALMEAGGKYAELFAMQAQYYT
ncbi:MAG: ABC transporter ATP-binding protein [Clostridia bacterium]|nr:ABC transporter ATP-binding protein [Clostridia bacterium]